MYDRTTLQKVKEAEGLIKQKADIRAGANKDLERVLKDAKASIVVIGCGGAGNNTVSRLKEINIEGAKCVAVNTDAQDLLYTDADEKILIGKELTGGLGAGANPKTGEAAAKETRDEIKRVIDGMDMIFLTCGLGGGTGTGALPVIAEMCKKGNSLTVAIVTIPFRMEGYHRMVNAKMGLEKLEDLVDTLIVIPNDKLMDMLPDVSINTAFKIADEILVNAVKGITELITKPGLINRDFADVKAVMAGGGIAMIGMGQSDTENRAKEVANKALNNPLLDVDIEGATGALINVSGGSDLTLKEAQEVVRAVTSKLSPEAKVIWGTVIEKEMKDTIRAMIIVTGVKSSQIFGPTHKVRDEERKEVEERLGIDFI